MKRRVKMRDDVLRKDVNENASMPWKRAIRTLKSTDL